MPIEAQEWHVAPRSAEVEINKFKHFQDVDPYPHRTNYTASNTAEADDRDAVERIFDGYHRTFEAHLRPRGEAGGAVLSLRGPSWPLAVSLDKYGLRDASEDVREAYLDLDYQEKG